MKKHISLALSLVLSAALFAACSTKEVKPTELKQTVQATEANKDVETKSTDKAEPKAEKVSLEDWAGTWNSIEGYYDEPEIKKAMEEKAKELNKTFDELKAEKSKESHVDWLGLKIDDKTITFLDNFASKNGKEIEKIEYVFKEMKQVGKEGEEHSQWAVFEAKDKNAKHPLLLMMPVHGEDEITHFHIRYGKSVDEMLKMDEWWPVMAKDSSTTQQVIEEVTH